eukprot:475736-Pyramimonas_sp.AAC.1
MIRDKPTRVVPWDGPSRPSFAVLCCGNPRGADSFSKGCNIPRKATVMSFSEAAKTFQMPSGTIGSQCFKSGLRAPPNKTRL